MKKTEKRLLQKVFKQTKNYHLFPYLTFAALIAMLIHHHHLTGRIVIDREYTGHEKLIHEKLTSYLKSLNQPHLPHVEFGHVGKLSCAHQVAYQTARGREKPTCVATVHNVFALIIGTKKDRC